MFTFILARLFYHFADKKTISTYRTFMYHNILLLINLVHLEGLEPPTLAFVGPCSNPLSYRCKKKGTASLKSWRDCYRCFTPLSGLTLLLPVWKIKKNTNNLKRLNFNYCCTFLSVSPYRARSLTLRRGVPFGSYRSKSIPIQRL